MDGYKLTPGEWDAYVSNLPDDALPNKRLYADAMFGTLRSDAAEAIGEDVNLMAKDRSIIHGSRARKKDDINLSQDQLKKLSRASSNPDAIYKDNATGNLIFRYAEDSENDIKIVLIPGNGITSLSLHTFFLRGKGVIDSDRRYSLLWRK